jgi:hypothetical protein
MDSVSLEVAGGYTILLDAADLPKVAGRAWHVHRYGPDALYATAASPEGTIYLHRLIMDAPKGMQVDHINGNGLDCRRSNMRLTTHKQNHQNVRGNARNTSGFKGVRWKKDHHTWEARIKTDGRTRHLGYFPTPEDAAEAYNRAAVQLFGEYANLNQVAS